ncbi:MAG TPA: PadR family transcriptional regulator [Acidimicrobiales bacterium]|nr:PadR family transcriptional regulator [Acidimicrobiales bacterium]
MVTRNEPTGTRTQWLKGVTGLILLSLLDAEPSYGYELAERLGAAGLRDLNEATVYGALRRMEAAGLVESHLVASPGGPARRYYTVTRAGRAHRQASADQWRRFVSTVDGILSSAEPTRPTPSAGSEAYAPSSIGDEDA